MSSSDLIVSLTDDCCLLFATYQVNSSISTAQEDLAEEEAKLQKQKEENVRRRHNYLPFVIKLVESLAGKRKLDELIASAQAAAATRAAEKEKAKSG
jgi:ubiquitin carboxyl-terminal hydrolase L5